VTDTRFQEHYNAFISAIHSVETGTLRQFELRDEIGYADKRIAELEFDEMTLLLAELAKSGEKTNADERAGRVAKRLKAHGIYGELVEERIDKNKSLLVHGAAVARLNEEARGHRKQMDWMIASVPQPPIVISEPATFR